MSLVCTFLVAFAIASAPRTGDPFADAGVAPPNVCVYLHVEDAEGLRDTLAGRPLEAGLGMVLDENLPAARAAITRLASDIGITPDALVDDYLGRSVTLLQRDDGWVLISTVAAPDFERLRRNGRCTPLGPVCGGSVAVFEMKRYEYWLAYREPHLLVCPADKPQLTSEVIQRLRGENTRVLAHAPSMRRGRALGDASIGMYVTHDAPMGGWSVATLSLDDEQIRIRHEAKFDNPPFDTRRSDAIDLSPLEGFDRAEFLVAAIEPTGRMDTFIDPLVEPYLRVALPNAIATTDMLDNRCSRRVVLLGEGDGRAAEPPFDRLFPTVAVAIEVTDPALAVKQFDRQLTGFAEDLSGIVGKVPGAVLRPPPLHRMRAGEPRHIDISPWALALLDDHPMARDLALHWVVTAGAGSYWQVVATDAALLEDVVGALQAGGGAAERRARVATTGFGRADRLGRYLRNVADHLPEGERSDDFRYGLRWLSGLSEGFVDFRWTMTEPSKRRVRFDVELDLAPPTSSSDEEAGSDPDD